NFKKGDPSDLVSLVGLEAAEEFAEAVLQSRVEWDELSEEEKELHRLRRENQGYKSKEEQAAERAAAERRQQLETQAVQQVETEIAEILSKAGKKSTPRQVARAVEYMLAQLDSSSGQ